MVRVSCIIILSVMLNEPFNFVRKMPDFISDMRLNFKHDVIEVCASHTESDDFARFMEDIEFYRNERLDLRFIKVSETSRDEQVFSDQIASTSGRHHSDSCSSSSSSASSDEYITFIGPGSGIVVVTSQCESLIDREFQRLSDIGDLLRSKRAPVFSNWSIGCLCKDKTSRLKYVITTYHCLEDAEREGLCFYSLAGDNIDDSSSEKPTKIASESLGAYGPTKIDGRMFFLDCLLLKVSEEEFLGEDAYVDMTFENPDNNNDERVELKFFADDLASFQDQEVFMVGFASGIRKGRIKNHDYGVKRIHDVPCKGLFCVETDETLLASICDAERLRRFPPRFAQPGDSGALVFGRHPENEQWMALGMVYGPKDAKSSDDVLCIRLKDIFRFLKDKHNMQLEWTDSKHA